MVEHLLCKQGVGGSSPLVSTTKVQVRALRFLRRRRWIARRAHQGRTLDRTDSEACASPVHDGHKARGSGD